VFALIALVCLILGLVVGIFDARIAMSALEWFVVGIGFAILGGGFPYPLPFDSGRTR